MRRRPPAAACRHHGLLALLEAFALLTNFKQWLNMTGVYRPNW